jgi:hypothetical protein
MFSEYLVKELALHEAIDSENPFIHRVSKYLRDIPKFLGNATFLSSPSAEAEGPGSQSRTGSSAFAEEDGANLKTSISKELGDIYLCFFRMLVFSRLLPRKRKVHDLNRRTGSSAFAEEDESIALYY